MSPAAKRGGAPFHVPHKAKMANGIATNADRLVEIAVRGEVAHPIADRSGYDVGRDGVLRTTPGVGGIVYSHFVGDPIAGIVGDHIEPGASVALFESKWPHDWARSALNVLAQIGNTAIVADGEAKGCIGTVIGKHGGVEEVLVHFPAAVLDAMDIGDPVRIRAYGAGLALDAFPDVLVKNTDPRLLDRMSLGARGNTLEVHVAHIIPAALMGSGLGADNTNRGDYDIQLSDPATVKKLGLDRLRFGDLIAIEDTYDAYGRSSRPGAMSIGAVVHGDSNVAGHGPGVTTLMAAPPGRLTARRDARANIADLLGLSRASPGDHHLAHLAARHKDRLRKL